MRGVMLDRQPLDQGDLDFAPLSASLTELRYYDHTAGDQRAARLARAQVALTNKVVLDRATLKACPDLRLISAMGTGTDHIDLQAAADCGITVCNCRGYATPAVTQHCFALMLALVTRLPDYQRAIAQGAWQRSTTVSLLDYPIGELAGQTLGIVGYGELGQSVARVGQAFGMRVLIAARPGTTDQRPGRVPFGALLAQADVLSLHCPLETATRNLVDAGVLTAMPNHAILINTARGALVNAPALAAALRRGDIAGAGIDVLDQEPPPADHPLLAPDLPNLILTPHNAWGSLQVRRRVLAQLAENTRAFRRGEPVRVVAVAS